MSYHPPIMENQMETKMENELDTTIVLGYTRGYTRGYIGFRGYISIHDPLSLFCLISNGP